MNQSELGSAKLTLLIYMDGLCKVLTKDRTVHSVASLSFGSISSNENEVQSTLDQFYNQNQIDQSRVESVELMFVNSIFHKTGHGKLETFKNRLPAFLLYHNEFFDVPVGHDHIAHRLTFHMSEWQRNHAEPVLWFHLREKVLYVLFSTAEGDSSISAFEVRKTLDVHYYILFNVQTLRPVIPDLRQITVSGELLNLDKMHNFFSENINDMELMTFWQWKGLLGRPHPLFNQYLPEVNI
ncbi:hypothetical protein KUV50_18670 [Membranicola marinus]|uniref:Uncharacterized protein n=1 Tax=Membranihabitans marinus TaxID=1227546 RepID=A0A953HS10_9BACT|nr:hypothetical protein [Membranihabitans marinus]MBY5960184.1 hypothetical protein [Membranihabitans marinus]